MRSPGGMSLSWSMMARRTLRAAADARALHHDAVLQLRAALHQHRAAQHGVVERRRRRRCCPSRPPSGGSRRSRSAPTRPGRGWRRSASARLVMRNFGCAPSVSKWACEVGVDGADVAPVGVLLVRLGARDAVGGEVVGHQLVALHHATAGCACRSRSRRSRACASAASQQHVGVEDVVAHRGQRVACGCPASAGVAAGFSLKSVMRWLSSISTMPNWSHCAQRHRQRGHAGVRRCCAMWKSIICRTSMR